MQEACKVRRALDQRWLALSTFALGIGRSGGRDAECSANCVVRTCVSSLHARRNDEVYHVPANRKSLYLRVCGSTKRDRNILHGARESRWLKDCGRPSVNPSMSGYGC